MLMKLAVAVYDMRMYMKEGNPCLN